MFERHFIRCVYCEYEDEAPTAEAAMELFENHRHDCNLGQKQYGNLTPVAGCCIFKTEPNLRDRYEHRVHITRPIESATPSPRGWPTIPALIKRPIPTPQPNSRKSRHRERAVL